MSLTRRLLRELELSDNAIERIIAAHAESIDALRTERDEARTALAQHEQAVSERDALREEAAAHQADAERLRTELDAFRQQVAAERTQAIRRNALCQALTRAGANPQAVPLLAQAVTTSDEDWAEDRLLDEDAALRSVREQYAPFFSKPRHLPTDRITPPLQPGGDLSLADVQRMSAEEINRHWAQVRSALMHP